MWLLIFTAFFLVVDVSISKNEQINVLGKRLKQCSTSPLTGYYRSGSCEWSGSHDYGVHTVCAQMTNQFLEFTRSRGNDLSTPHNSSQFPGLRQGDRWCLCAARWKEAFLAKVAPPVLLQSTHRITLQHVKLDDLQTYAYRNNTQRRF
ncbi:hypothetical protein I4U23_009259 [Adineta vaga]|nr:hypothetical protein I4U23_009259 [Adineta vaga]